jgi:hypothetical protein
VTGLVICLMLARAGVRWLLYDTPSPAAEHVPD